MHFIDCPTLEPLSLNEADQCLAYHLEQEEDVHGEVEANDVEELCPKVIPVFWVRHVVCPEKQEPGANEDDYLIEHLDEVVGSVYHGLVGHVVA